MIGLQCLTCTRVHPTGTAEGWSACDAFLDGIPVEIQTGEVDHRRPYPGDRGLRYAPVPGTDLSEMDEPPLTELQPTADEPLI